MAVGSSGNFRAGAALCAKAFATALAILPVSPSHAGPPTMDPETGYRIAVYRAPVNLPPVGGDRIDLAALDKLRKDGAVLVDVMPARAGYEAKDGHWLLVEKRMDIPDSTWLPNVGMGRLEPRLAAYFTESMKKLTAGDTGKSVVFYCMADCWMSWNAVKRAAGMGYKNVHWYAEGTDGWFESGRDLVDVKPPPVPPLPASVQN